MSVYTMRYAIEKGAEIVCAFGRSPRTIGQDIGSIAGVGETGVLVQDAKDAVAILKEKQPDACIITTASLMQDLKGPLMDCAESGVNAITTGEESVARPTQPGNPPARFSNLAAEKCAGSAQLCIQNRSSQP